MKHVCIFFLLLPLAIIAASADTGVKTSERFSVLGLAFNSEVQSGQSNVRGVNVSLLFEERESVRGVAVGLGASDIDGDMTGVQFAIFGCSNEKLNGVQLAGLYAYNYTFDGVAVAGLFNTAGYDGTSRGIQIAGVLNIDGLAFSGSPDPLIKGGQIALLGNGACRIQGVQVALGINGADACSGLQIALLNYATTLRGLQIGLVNLAEEGSGLQIGLYNSFGQTDKQRTLPLVNWRF